VYSFYGTSETERTNSLRVVARRGGVLLTTYGMGAAPAPPSRSPRAPGGHVVPAGSAPGTAAAMP
jgi:hypothetical protein